MKASGSQRRLLHRLLDREEGEPFVVPLNPCEQRVFDLLDGGFITIALTDKGREEIRDEPATDEDAERSGWDG